MSGEGLTAEERRALTAALATKDGCWDYEECCWSSFEALERALVPLIARRESEAAEKALRDAAGAIQALHPGEVKNSVIWLRARADSVAQGREEGQR